MQHSADWITYRGIYHLSTGGETSWYGFAKAIFEKSGSFESTGLKTVTPIPSSQYPSLVKRPHYSVLNTDKLAQTFDLTMPHWKQALALVLHERLAVSCLG